MQLVQDNRQLLQYTLCHHSLECYYSLECYSIRNLSIFHSDSIRSISLLFHSNSHFDSQTLSTNPGPSERCDSCSTVGNDEVDGGESSGPIERHDERVRGPKRPGQSTRGRFFMLLEIHCLCSVLYSTKKIRVLLSCNYGGSSACF